jgi:hypothetical protein
MRGQNRATRGRLVIDDHRRPVVKLVPDLHDFGGEWHVLSAVVGPFAGHERFDHPVQGVRTEQVVGNDPGRAGSSLRIVPPSRGLRRYRACVRCRPQLHTSVNVPYSTPSGREGAVCTRPLTRARERPDTGPSHRAAAGVQTVARRASHVREGGRPPGPAGLAYRWL